MICNNKLFSTLIITVLLIVTGCDKPAKTPAKSSLSSQSNQSTASQPTLALTPVEVAGVNLRTTNRQILTEAFSRESKVVFIPRNDWESVANVNGTWQGADTIELATTKGGAFAFLQAIFPGSADGKQRASVQQLIEAKYGKPTEVDGRSGSGEYRAIWDMGGDFLIQVSSGGSEKATFLIYVFKQNLIQMKSEYQETLNARAKQKTVG